MNIVLTSEYGGCFLLSIQNKRLAKKGEFSKNKTRYCFDGEPKIFQTDYEFPTLASSLGWNMINVQSNKHKSCDHYSTDGTVDCEECGLKALDFITSASEWLHDNDGRVFRNKGLEYFNPN